MSVRLAAIVEQCVRAVVDCRAPEGLSELQLRLRLPDLDRLPLSERFRVLTLLAQHRYIASDSHGGEWRFWGRHRAPPGAYRAPV